MDPQCRFSRWVLRPPAAAPLSACRLALPISSQGRRRRQPAHHAHAGRAHGHLSSPTNGEDLDAARPPPHPCTSSTSAAAPAGVGGAWLRDGRGGIDNVVDLELKALRSNGPQLRQGVREWAKGNWVSGC